MGVYDYILKPYNKASTIQRLAGHLRAPQDGYKGV
jgi:PleD family two-component response regulator